MCYELDTDMTLMFRQFVNTFVYELGVREPNLAKHAKIDQLRLNNDEQKQVELFTSLLVVCYVLICLPCH